MKVNGEIITKTEFETRQGRQALRIAQSWRRPAGEVSASKSRCADHPGPDSERCGRALLIQRGRESGYTLVGSAVRHHRRGHPKSNNLEDEARFQEALKQEGLTMDDLRRNLERTMIVQQVTRRDHGQDQHQR